VKKWYICGAILPQRAPVFTRKMLKIGKTWLKWRKSCKFVKNRVKMVKSVYLHPLYVPYCTSKNTPFGGVVWKLLGLPALFLSVFYEAPFWVFWPIFKLFGAFTPIIFTKI
jgi:hypothetical protein